MKLRKFQQLGMAGSLAVSLTWSAVIAAEDPKGAEPKATAAASPMVPIRVWKRTRSFERLEREILTKVTLDAEQRTKVKKAFEDLYSWMAEDPQRSAYGPSAYRAYSPEELKKRRDDLKHAKKAGNEKLVKEIEADMEKHQVGSPANLTRVPEDIITDLTPVMKGAQIADYQRVVDRWKTLEPGGPDDGPVRMLVRAVEDPELKITAEQRTKAMRILSDTMKAAPRNRDFEKMAELGKQAHEEMLKMLNSRQQQHLNQTLRMLAADMKAVREYAEKWFANRGRAVPAYHKRTVPWED